MDENCALCVFFKATSWDEVAYYQSSFFWEVVVNVGG